MEWASPPLALLPVWACRLWGSSVGALLWSEVGHQGRWFWGLLREAPVQAMVSLCRGLALGPPGRGYKVIRNCSLPVLALEARGEAAPWTQAAGSTARPGASRVLPPPVEGLSQPLKELPVASRWGELGA